MKKIFLLLLTVLLVFAVWQWELLTYALAQGKGQLRIVWNAQPVDELMQRSDFPDSLKQKLQIIANARRFAIDELGLKDTDNYTTYYDQRGEVLLWNVSACKPYAFEAHMWWFPIVGQVPYKGFFKKERAQAEIDRLKAEGWEVRARPVSGWSTLGWFKDPILSDMLDRSEGALADLIIHELTHATLFVPNEVTYNENLASFVGEKGAERYLIAQYGNSSEQYRSYVASTLDSEKFQAHVLRGTRSLDSLYKAMVNESVEKKEVLKQAMIGRIVQTLDTVSFVNERYRRIFNSPPNNAYFMSYLRYHSFEDSLQAQFENEFAGNLKTFIADAVRRYGN